jgi:hypothetical protein
VQSRHRVGAVDVLNVLNVLNVLRAVDEASRPAGRGTSSAKVTSKRCRRRKQPQAVMAEDPQTARAGHSGE